MVCEEVGRNKTPACSVMGHELLHAFDKCRAKLDFTNPRHVACTEVRSNGKCYKILKTFLSVLKYFEHFSLSVLKYFEHFSLSVLK